MKKKFPITVVLENIRSALNVGAMFRTSDGAGIEKIYLTGITPYPPHNKIPKTALGAIEMVKWEHNKNTFEIVNSLKEKGNKIVSLEITDNAKIYTEYNFEKPTTLILGNEIAGVSKEITDLSDDIVYVPMFGDKESLNVATTFGIVVYEIIRQWKYSKT